MRRFTRLASFALMWLSMVPAAYAQGTLSGVVKDTSGAV